MIEIRDLTKIYRGKHHQETVALRGLNFCLPDRGMVFVVGKSGCGKSTLLNVISGGDRFTSGEIVVDGNPMSAFSVREYDSFRCNAMGLIFQDYCLLDGLTVKENVALSLQLANKRDDARVDEAISLVELGEKADSYPQELSGGQRQRVAIARALVKDAKYILADEPTGNLDAASARNILLLLKEISKRRLVLIVSHCRADADEFADRIIELSDGRIVSDRTRDEKAEELCFGEREIVFQRGHDFSEEELAEVNRRLAGGGELKQVDTRFLPTVQPAADGERAVFPRSRIGKGGARTLFRMFTKKRLVSMALSALCIVFMFIVLGVSQFFTRFDADAETARILQENSSPVFAMRKGYIAEDDPTNTVDTTRLLRVTEEDVAAFRAAGYEGNIFPLYGVSMITHSGANARWEVQGYKPPPEGLNYNQFYCHTGLGVLQVTKEYLAGLYGKDGELDVLSGKLPEEGDGVIVTDYFADSILVYSDSLRMAPAELAAGADRYQKLTNGKIYSSRFRIAAVIGTGYAERYAPLIEAWKNGQKIVDAEEELSMRFYEELNASLNLGYTFNPDFMAAYDADAGRTFSYYGSAEVTIDGKLGVLGSKYIYADSKLKDDEIAVNENICRDILGQTEEEDVDWSVLPVGKKLGLKLYELHADDCYFEGEFTVKRTYRPNADGHSFYVSPAVFQTILPHAVYAYALYFDDVEGAMAAYETGVGLGYAMQSPLVSAMYTVSRAVLVFVEFFDIIIWVMYALMALTLAGFAVGSIKKCIYEIGVVRAMGGRTHNLVQLFVLQMLLVCAIVCLVSGLGLYLGAGLGNAVLADGFATITKNIAMHSIRFVSYSWVVVLADSGVVFALTALCSVAPLLLLRRIKPREIIRAKE